MSRRPRRAVTAVVLGATMLATAALTSTAESTTPAAHADPKAHPIPAGYGDQVIDWRPCFPDGPPEGLPRGSERLECGSFTAPRDWADPAGGTDITVAVSRLPATGGGDAAALFTNPGGPGGAGRFVPLLFLLTDRQRLLASQDIYGIDVRGTGGSTATSCDGGSNTGILLDVRDRSQDNVDLVLDSADLITRFCQTGTGEFGQFVRTDQTVHDLDLLRHLVGREQINWLGYSGGTWLGAYYATYFPERVGRFVFDSNAAFTDPWQTTFDLQPLGFQRRFEQDFLPWAAAHDDVFGLGATPAEVNNTYEQLRAELAAEPLDFGGGLGLYAADLDALLAFGMYSKTVFPVVAETVGFLREDVANREAPENRSPLSAQLRAEVERLREVRAHTGGLQPLAPDSMQATFLHIICGDTAWPGDRQSVQARSQQQGEAYPLVGWYQLSNPCISWQRPEVALPTPTGAGVPPVLMVQTVRDPATAIEGALRAREGFAGARLLTVTDEGDHTIYATAVPNDCVNDTVEDYLADGVVPAGDISCPGVPIPPPVDPDAPVLPFSVDGLTGTPQQLIEALTTRAEGR